MVAQPTNTSANGRPVTLDLRALTTPASAVGSAGAVIAIAGPAGIDPLAAVFLSYAVGLTVGVISALLTGQVATQATVRAIERQTAIWEARAMAAEADNRDLEREARAMAAAALDALKAVAAR